MAPDAPIRVLIVDDEPLARRGVAVRLEAQPGMEIVGEASSGGEAIESIRHLQPDLIFLDIQMPDLSGIDVLRALPPDAVAAIIFLTAYDEYALAAFEVQALDYLLKPIDEVRFERALARAREFVRMYRHKDLYQRFEKLIALHDERKTEPFIRRVPVKSGKQIGFVPVEHIDWIEAAGDYVELHVAGKTHLLREALSSLELRLDPARFVRVHRSAIVQLDRITHIRALTNRDGYLTLRDGRSLRLSRNYSTRVRLNLKSLNTV
jgi:two-component system LytT family response regulator